MNRTQCIAALAIIALVLAHPCRAQQQANQTRREATPPEQTLSHVDNVFSFNLFHEINKADPGNNLLISPFSVALALTMAYNGADGRTKAAMENTLELAGFEGDELNQANKSLLGFLRQLDPEVQMEIANSIWYRESLPVKDSFINVNSDYYDAEIRPLDFDLPQAIKTINNWVDLKTHGKITEIIGQIDPSHQMLLIDAMYLKAPWTQPFSERATRSEPFFVEAGNPVTCQMMTMEHHFAYWSNDRFQAINLPFGSGEFGMTVILPAKETDLDGLIGSLNNEVWIGILDSVSSAYGQIIIPKLEFSYSAKLKNQLSALGMAECFDDRADFSGISKTQLWIDEVMHKTYIKTDEKGAEAAAVTGVIMCGSAVGSDPQPKFTMRVDRPFIFTIRERRTGAILFLGKVVDPTAE